MRFSLKISTSDGNDLNNFPENQLTKFRADYTVKVNRGQKFCRQSFTQNLLSEKLKSQIHRGVRRPQFFLNDAPVAVTAAAAAADAAALL